MFPWALTLLRSTGALWVYPFWHNYGLIHVALPMAALVTLTLVLTDCALREICYACKPEGGAGKETPAAPVGSR